MSLDFKIVFKACVGCSPSPLLPALVNVFSIRAKPCPCSAAPSGTHTDELRCEPGCQVGNLNSSAVIFNKNINCLVPF